jgi:hypothetical protein
MNVFILFSPPNVTMFYAHFSIFKLNLDLQHCYARAKLTIKGLVAECRNSSLNVGVTSLKFRECSEIAVERNTFLRRNELNYQKVWPTLLESFATDLLTFERDDDVRGNAIFTSNAVAALKLSCFAMTSRNLDH